MWSLPCTLFLKVLVSYLSVVLKNKQDLSFQILLILIIVIMRNMNKTIIKLSFKGYLVGNRHCTKVCMYKIIYR